jgi:CarboxypepD_reg-like domain/TonB-dependent Receptor Plug Domain
LSFNLRCIFKPNFQNLNFMLKTRTYIAFAFSFISFFAFSQTKVTISGTITERGSREQLIGVNVFVLGTTIGTSSNQFGYYSLTIPQSDSATMVYSYVGYEPLQKKLLLNKNYIENISLESSQMLNEVVVSAKKNDDRVSDNVQMGQIEIPINQIKKIPTLLGEKDVLKVLQLMPGVQKGSEGQAGIYVRGGGPDQNLIILDDAVVYNANHLFGFFSTFNGDALKSVELTKAGFPAKYGGRLSSVIDLNMKDGNKEKFSGEGGIGLISSRLVLEGPIKNKKGLPAKASFLLSARRTYLDAIIKPILLLKQKGEENKQLAGYFFHDYTAKFNYEINAKNKLYLSGYFGKDKFYANVKDKTSVLNSSINWGNTTSTLRWNHIYNQKLFSNTSLIYSNFNFGVINNQSYFDKAGDKVFELKYDSGVRDFALKQDFDYFVDAKNTLRFGVQTTQHRFNPSAIVLKNTQSKLFESRSNVVNSLETAIYVEDQLQASANLKMNIGLRAANYLVNKKAYFNLEPRLGIAIKPKPDLAIKGSYARMNQNIHLLSNTGLGLPTDLWVPATAKVKPQQSDQWSVGIAKDLNQGLTLTVESYYKTMKNIINYKDGASFLDIDDPNNREATKQDWQDKVARGTGNSYGFEILLQKKTGRFSGWIGYTWSKTQWTFPELNFGKPFFPKYDRRHDISIVGIYELKKNITLSGTWVYGTGNALAVPLAEYSSPLLSEFGLTTRNTNEYGQKNSFRAEPYHRFDLGIQFHKKVGKHDRTWDFSIYNLYSRKNPFFYQVENNQNSIQNPSQNPSTKPAKLILKRYSLFPIIPSFSYNFKF